MSFIMSTTKSVVNLHHECKENLYTFSENIMSFGKWLSEKRIAANLTQEQLASRVSGVSISYISAIEREEPNSRDGSPRRPRVEKVDALARALGADVSEARLAAGYAPAVPAEVYEIDLGPGVKLKFGEKPGLDWADEEELRSIINAVLKRVRVRKNE